MAYQNSGPNIVVFRFLQGKLLFKRSLGLLRRGLIWLLIRLLVRRLHGGILGVLVVRMWPLRVLRTRWWWIEWLLLLWRLIWRRIVLLLLIRRTASAIEFCGRHLVSVRRFESAAITLTGRKIWRETMRSRNGHHFFYKWDAFLHSASWSLLCRRGEQTELSSASVIDFDAASAVAQTFLGEIGWADAA